MSRDFDVICIGLAAANILIHPISKSFLDADVSLVNKMEIIPGGDAVNQAIILARLGRKVKLCGKIGADLFGRCLAGGLENNGVDISTVIVDESENTSSCAVLVQANGNRNFLSYRGANESFSLLEIPDVFNARIVSIGGLLALPLLNGGDLKGFLKTAKEKGCITAVDTKHDSYRIGWDGVKDGFDCIDYFLPSYDEAAYLSGETEPGRIAGFFLEAGVKNVVIKMGVNGSFLKSAVCEEAIPAISAQAVDTTGAGDNFVAGFLHGLLYGWDIKKCCEYANAVGAVSTTKLGATMAVESEVQVNDYLKNHCDFQRSV